MARQGPTTLAPGWYADPWDDGVLVWWDGDAWGAHAPMTTVDPVLPVAPLTVPHDDVPAASPRLEPVALPARARRCRACGQASRSWESTCQVCGVPLPHGEDPERAARPGPLHRAWWTPLKAAGIALVVVLAGCATVATASPDDYRAGYDWGVRVVQQLDPSTSVDTDADGDLAAEIDSTCSSAAYGNYTLGGEPVDTADPAAWMAGCVAGMSAAAGIG